MYRVVYAFFVIALCVSFGFACSNVRQQQGKTTTELSRGYFHIKEHDNYKVYRGENGVGGHVRFLLNESQTTDQRVIYIAINWLSNRRMLIQLVYTQNAVTCNSTSDHSALIAFHRLFTGCVDDDDDDATAYDVTADELVTKVGGRTIEMTEFANAVGGKSILADVLQYCPAPDSSQGHAGTRRQKRSLPLIVPGTRWCGVGNVSADGQSFGDIVATDRCCNQHDRCSYTIEGFTYKYGYYNFRFHTISHCECDDMFRSCLRGVGTEEADMVGQLYFDIIGMKCFVLKRETECVDRAWWGKCNRYQYTDNSYAELHGPLSY